MRKFSLLLILIAKLVSAEQGVIYLDNNSSPASIDSKTLSLLFNFEEQSTISYCGIASAVMVLNTIGVKPDFDTNHFPYKRFNQTNIFNNKYVLDIITPQKVCASGMSMSKLASFIAFYAQKVTVNKASDMSYKDFITRLKTAVAKENTYVIANFDRSVIGQQGFGHFSPISAYDENIDSFLVLDVARYKLKPFWIDAKLLYRSMLSTDTAHGESRGYLQVS